MSLRTIPSVLGKRTLRELYSIPARTSCLRPIHPIRLPLLRQYATVEERKQDNVSIPPPGFNPAAENLGTSSAEPKGPSQGQASKTDRAEKQSTKPSHSPSASFASDSQSEDWEENPNLSISEFSELPDKNFGVNQHIVINEEFKEALRLILWQFKAPIRYAFAYGSGVFPQSGSPSSTSSLHPSPPDAITKVQGGGQKMIDFIFGVTYTQHWHDLNLQQHRDHYSGIGTLGSYAVSQVQDSFGAGVYFNPYINVNGTLIKYGVVNLDTLCRDLAEWDTLYLAGRLQKPVKILRDQPSVRLANQVNLISAVRTALLLLPPDFTEYDLYSTIAGISYLGDPRMSIGGDDPRKVSNIVRHQLPNFRRLYAPLISNLPNIAFTDPSCSDADWMSDPTINARLSQNMDPITRGHMVRRLPKSFRQKLYFEYQAKFHIPRGEFNEMLAKAQDEDPDHIRRREGGPFEQRIAKDTEGIKTEVKQVIEKTVRWPSFTQSVKGVVTAGVGRSWRYAVEKREKNLASRRKDEEREREEGDAKKGGTGGNDAEEKEKRKEEEKEKKE